MKKRMLSILLCVGMVSAMLAGCGGSSNETAAPAETEAPAEEEQEAEAPEAEAPEAEAPEAETAEFTTVEEGKLIMATNAAFPPYEFMDGDEIVGIDPEIAGLLADKLGLELEIQDMDFDSIVTAISSGKVDVGLAGMTVTPDRQENVNFTTSYATGVQVIIVPEDSDIQSADDLADKLIGVQQGTTGHIYCSDDFGEDHVVALPNGATAVQNLVNGQVDCVVIDEQPAKEFVKANEGLKILDTEYTVEDYAIAVSKDNQPLTDALDAAIQELIADGSVQAILDKYIKSE